MEAFAVNGALCCLSGASARCSELLLYSCSCAVLVFSRAGLAVNTVRMFMNTCSPFTVHGTVQI